MTRKVGRPFQKDKNKMRSIRIDESLCSEVNRFLPVYSRKLKFRVTLTGFVEKAIRECLEREKNETE